MRKMLTSILFASIVNLTYSQSIPADSLYLGQAKPGSTPLVFKLSVTKGLVAAERITITADNKEIYYGELDTWPATVQRIKCYKYLNNKWQGPFITFEGYIAPSLSLNDSIIYMQKAINNNSATCTFYSVRKNGGWTEPKRLLTTNLNVHYFQATNSKNFYAASVPPNSPGGSFDLCKFVIQKADTTLESLGTPINTTDTENDFYIARDESYIIFCRFAKGSASDLYISYKDNKGNWTEPKNMGIEINTPNPNWECCPFVTKDNKYLFFMRGGNELSSYFIYWVSVDKLIERLKNSNH